MGGAHGRVARPRAGLPADGTDHPPRSGRGNPLTLVTQLRTERTQLRESPTPRIVNVSSGVGSLALDLDPTTPYRQAFGVTYAASKTALNAVTVSFAIELEDAGVKVRAVSPGFAATSLNDYAGTETVEAGSRSIVAAVLDADGPTGTFTGPEGPIPW